VNLLQRRALVSVAGTLAVVLVAVVLVARYVVEKHLWGKETLEQIEPRYARLLGLRDISAKLDEALKGSRTALSRLGHPAGRDAAQVGNDLQQVARRALQAAGLSITSSQVLSPRAESGFERVSVSLQADGSLSGVQIALAALQTETPRILFESVSLQSTGRTADDGTPIVSCRLTVAVLRLQS
jgi:general secretion pathway protein M